MEDDLAAEEENKLINEVRPTGVLAQRRELKLFILAGVQNMVSKTVSPYHPMTECVFISPRKKNAPYLYDLVITHALDWPSLTCQWFPDKESCVLACSRLLPLTARSLAPQTSPTPSTDCFSARTPLAKHKTTSRLPPFIYQSATVPWQTNSIAATTTMNAANSADTLYHHNRASKSYRKSTMRAK